MARIRSVHPDICEDETLARVSAYAERTFVRLWTYLDDEGRGKDQPRLIAARLYPMHDRVDVERDLAELAAVGLLLRYEVAGKGYLAAKPEAWARYQKPRRKVESKLPAPDIDGTCADIVRTPPDKRRNRPAGDGGGEGDGDGDVTPHSREPRGTVEPALSTDVDNPKRSAVALSERAARHARTPK